jgi:hypothetical protein
MPYRLAAFFSCLFFLACAQADPVKRLENLDILEWTHRVILISVDAMQKPEILQRLEQEKADLDERHIAWFLLSDDDILSNLDAGLSPALDEVIKKEHFRNSNRWGQTRLIRSNALSRVISMESDPIGPINPKL